MTRIRDCKTIAMYMALQWLCNRFAITMALQWLCNRFAMALQWPCNRHCKRCNVCKVIVICVIKKVSILQRTAMNCKGQWLCNRFATALQWRFALQSTSVVPFTIRIFPQHAVIS
jgi:hypothetical protein